ncbi:MAG: ATP synthase F1 subunit epsilon [Bacteroidetes bacterium]|jgi:F-type H+-transporting ATPase subunit epsilon|nr:MAG: ATP synthase F1 subunit epsilon [Bacteroidota bacterium]
MIVEIITPDKVVFEGEANKVLLPGIDGWFEILDHHAPLVSILGAGEIKVTDPKKKEHLIAVNGGVIEVNDNHVKILAE